MAPVFTNMGQVVPRYNYETMKGIPIFVLLSSRQYGFIWNEFLFLPFTFQERVNRKEASTNKFSIVYFVILLSISCIFETFNAETSGDHLP